MLSGLGTLFYLVPIKAPFKSVEDVPDYISQAVPFFLLLMLLEFVYGKWRRYELYTLKDTIMSLSLGIVQQLLGIFVKEVSYVPYTIVYTYCTPFHQNLFPKLVSSYGLDTVFYIVGLLGVDCGYYWFHRMAHQLHLLWSSHAVHHSGERYNLATALRQGATQSLFSWLVYLPLAVIGLPPVHLVRHTRLNTLYQFWIHTEVVHRMPSWFEWIMNTPSHHRMHHKPPGNCNYAGVFIIWDRLFGTFESETQHLLPPATDDCATLAHKFRSGMLGYRRNVVFGLAQPLNTFDPVFANLQHFARLHRMVAQKTGLSGWPLHWQWLQVVFSARVVHDLKIETNPAKQWPDILFDSQLHELIARAKGKGGLSKEEASALQAIVQLPPPIPPLPLLATSPDAARFTPREVTFLNGREEREGTLTSYGRWTLVHHFAWTLVVAYALLLVHDKPVWNGQPLSLATQASVAALCVWSLQWIKLY